LGSLEVIRHRNPKSLQNMKTGFQVSSFRAWRTYSKGDFAGTTQDHFRIAGNTARIMLEAWF
jgi:hypothetical protein